MDEGDDYIAGQYVLGEYTTPAWAKVVCAWCGQHVRGPTRTLWVVETICHSCVDREYVDLGGEG